MTGRCGMTPQERRRIAEFNVEQIKRWQPSDDFGQRMKQQNLKQAKAYLDRLDDGKAAL